MTSNEKKLNYLDLQVKFYFLHNKQNNKFYLKAYKGLDPSLFAMIPGWSPQVGVIKPFQNLDPKLAENLLPNNSNNNSLIQNTEGDAQNPSPILKKQPYFTSNAAVTNLGNFIEILHFYVISII